MVPADELLNNVKVTEDTAFSVQSSAQGHHQSGVNLQMLSLNILIFAVRELTPRESRICPVTQLGSGRSRTSHQPRLPHTAFRVHQVAERSQGRPGSHSWSPPEGHILTAVAKSALMRESRGPFSSVSPTGGRQTSCVQLAKVPHSTLPSLPTLEADPPLCRWEVRMVSQCSQDPGPARPSQAKSHPRQPGGTSPADSDGSAVYTGPRPNPLAAWLHMACELRMTITSYKGGENETEEYTRNSMAHKALNVHYLALQRNVRQSCSRLRLSTEASSTFPRL